MLNLFQHPSRFQTTRSVFETRGFSRPATYQGGGGGDPDEGLGDGGELLVVATRRRFLKIQGSCARPPAAGQHREALGTDAAADGQRQQRRPRHARTARRSGLLVSRGEQRRSSESVGCAVDRERHLWCGSLRSNPGASPEANAQFLLHKVLQRPNLAHFIRSNNALRPSDIIGRGMTGFQQSTGKKR